MPGFGQKGPVFIQFKGGRPASWISVFVLIAGGLFFLVFGVWLLMIVATLLVLSLPYLWWKKRKLMQQVQAQMQQFQQYQSTQSHETFNEPSTAAGDQTNQAMASGVVIEGEVLQKRQED